MYRDVAEYTPWQPVSLSRPPIAVSPSFKLLFFSPGTKTMFRKSQKKNSNNFFISHKKKKLIIGRLLNRIRGLLLRSSYRQRFDTFCHQLPKPMFRKSRKKIKFKNPIFFSKKKRPSYLKRRRCRLPYCRQFEILFFKRHESSVPKFAKKKNSNSIIFQIFVTKKYRQKIDNRVSLGPSLNIVSPRRFHRLAPILGRSAAGRPENFSDPSVSPLRPRDLLGRVSDHENHRGDHVLAREGT